MGIIIAILLFSFIIIFHELGHFFLAKANGIRVDEFSLGLGPTLIGKKIGGTFFCIKLLPFGGACMMGEDDAGRYVRGKLQQQIRVGEDVSHCGRAAFQSAPCMDLLHDPGGGDRLHLH